MRRLYLTLAIVSGILCAATAALWVRSYWLTDWVRYGGIYEGYFALNLLSGGGQFGLAVEPPIWRIAYGLPPDGIPGELNAECRYWHWESVDTHRDGLVPEDDLLLEHWNFAGFGRYRLRPGNAPYDNVTILPAWLPVAMTGLGCLIFARAYHHRRHPRPGHCPSCGYDLRATPAKCPECGAAAMP